MVQAPCLPRSNFVFSINFLTLSKLLTYSNTQTRTHKIFHLFIRYSLATFLSPSFHRFQLTFQDRLLFSSCFYIFHRVLLQCSSLRIKYIKNTFRFRSGESFTGLIFWGVCVWWLYANTYTQYTHARTLAWICERASAKQTQRKSKIETWNTHVNDKW